jgi:hypothetical protein
MKPSCHRLILFLPLFCNCQFQRLDSTQFLCSQLISRQAGVPKLDSSLLFYSALCCRTLLYYHFARTTQKTQPLFLMRCRCLAMYVLLLLSLAPAGMCSPSHCLVTGLYVTIYLQPYSIPDVSYSMATGGSFPWCKTAVS